MILGASSFAGNLAELKDSVDSIELYIPKLGVYEGSKQKKERLENILDELSVYGFESTVHTPYFAQDPNYPSALLVDTSRMGPREFRLMEESIRLANRIGAGVVVLHPGRVGPKREKAFASMVENLKKLASTAGDYGVLLGLENKEGTDPLNLCCGAEELVRAIDAIASENLRATFDIGHANLTCGGDKKKMEHFVSTIKRHIVHMHLHDNHGLKTDSYDGDEHLAPGKGTVDYAVLNLVPEYRGVYNMEVFSIEDILAGKKTIQKALNGY